MNEALRQARNKQAVGRLVAGAAHDFSNVLMILESSLALLNHPLDDATRQRILAGMRRAVAQGSELTRRMRDFSGQAQSEARAADLRVLLPAIRQKLGESLAATTRVELDCAENLASVKVDAEELELALLNLSLNSQESMPDGGTIRIAARDTPEGVVISVTDTGKGMAQEERARAFEPFYTTKQSNGSCGLGLSQVYSFVLRSDGQVRIASESGRGTTVEIALPRTGTDPA